MDTTDDREVFCSTVTTFGIQEFVAYAQRHPEINWNDNEGLLNGITAFLQETAARMFDAMQGNRMASMVMPMAMPMLRKVFEESRKRLS